MELLGTAGGQGGRPGSALRPTRPRGAGLLPLSRCRLLRGGGGGGDV